MYRIQLNLTGCKIKQNKEYLRIHNRKENTNEPQQLSISILSIKNKKKNSAAVNNTCKGHNFRVGQKRKFPLVKTTIKEMIFNRPTFKIPPDLILVNERGRHQYTINCDLCEQNK